MAPRCLPAPFRRSNRTRRHEAPEMRGLTTRRNTSEYVLFVTIREYEWDDDNVDHIAAHGVTPEEVENCLRAAKIRRGRDGRYVALCRTAGGRHLLVVFAYRGAGRVRVVTARDMEPRERRLYGRK